MDGRGGCCLVRYAGGADVASKVERIMLRYRPIAPKPSSPAGSPPPAATEPTESRGRGRAGGTTSRRRRKKEAAGRRGRKRRAPYPGEAAARKRQAPPAADLVTLPLMPETPVATAAATPQLPDLALSHQPSCESPLPDGPGALAAPAMSWLTLECVTETCEGTVGRFTWAEARAALERDACPGFLSDEADRVVWANPAYERMVDGERGEVVVVLVSCGRVPGVAACGAFSCRLRVRCARGRREEKAWSLVVPCDVWRLAEGGLLAWRLDVKAALSLGR